MPVEILSSTVTVATPDTGGASAVESVVEVHNDTPHTYESVELVVLLRDATGTALATDTAWEGTLNPGEQRVVQGTTSARLGDRGVRGCTAQLTLRRTERASAPVDRLVNHVASRASDPRPRLPSAPPPVEDLTIDLAALDEAFASAHTAVWDDASYLAGAMRLHAFTHPDGDGLVLQALLTGRGDYSLRLEVWGYGPAFGEGQVREAEPVERVAEEELVLVSDDGSVCYHPTEVTVSAEGEVLERHEKPMAHHSVRIDGEWVQVALDLEEPLRRHLDPVAGMAVLLGRELHRYEAFLDAERLRAHMGLPEDATHLFSVDEWLHPSALQPASSSLDLLAVLEALAARADRPRLPVATSHAAQLHARFEVLGPWGFPAGWG